MFNFKIIFIKDKSIAPSRLSVRREAWYLLAALELNRIGLDN